MGQVLHGCATTTEAVRRAIQNSSRPSRPRNKSVPGSGGYGRTQRKSDSNGNGIRLWLIDPDQRLSGEATSLALAMLGTVLPHLEGCMRRPIAEMPAGTKAHGTALFRRAAGRRRRGCSLGGQLERSLEETDAFCCFSRCDSGRASRRDV